MGIDLHTVDVGEESLTKGVCSLVKGKALGSPGDPAGDNPRGGGVCVWNAVTCLTRREHAAPQSRGVRFRGNPAARYQNIHLI